MVVSFSGSVDRSGLRGERPYRAIFSAFSAASSIAPT